MLSMPRMSRPGWVLPLVIFDTAMKALAARRALANGQRGWALALVLTLSGLFSVLSYIVEQRTREMGVRLALGSTSRGVAVLVLTQMARPVLVGLLAGTACTLVLSAALLASPAAADVAATVELLDPIAYGLSGLAVTIATAGQSSANCAK